MIMAFAVQVKPHPKSMTVNGEKTYIDSKECYRGAKACKEFEKREGEEMGTYWTKCGLEFKKATKAATTGYAIDPNDKDCADCPFQVDVTEGWPPVHKRWECRAGSQPPNHSNDWEGSLEDKNTIHILSLDNDFLEAILEYCEADPELGAGYNQDRPDCRRQIGVSCSPNKKGMAAKKALIDHFFTEAGQEQEPDVQSCRTCVNFEVFAKVNHAGSYGNCHKNGDSYPVYIPDSKCKNYIAKDPVLETAIVKPELEQEPAAKDETPKITTEDKPWQPKCPYLESIGQNTINCAIHGKKFMDKGFETNGELLEQSAIYCFHHFDWCDTYQQAYKSEMESEDPDIKQYHVCAYCCNNSGYTGLSDSSKGAEYGYCQIWHEDRKKHDPNTVCKYFNQKYREDEDQVIDDVEKCKIKNEDCGYYCKHNGGCSLLLSRGDALKSIMDNFGQVDCDTYRDMAPNEDVEPAEDTARDVVPAGELKPFDYSIVDSKTADFLQEKASRITEVRIKSIIAIGKELKEAQDQLASHNKYEGVFIKWTESIGLKKSTVYNYIQAYGYVVQNLDNIQDAENIQPSILFAISKPSANPSLAEAAVAGDIKTYKEYKELEARLKAEQTAKADAEAKMQQAQAEKNEALRTYEKDITYLHEQLEDAKKKADPGKVKRLENQISDLQQEIEDLRSRPVEVAVKEIIPDDMKKELERLKLRQPKYQDYENVGRILDELSLFTIEKIWNWANVVAEDADRETIAELRIRAEKAVKAVQEIHRAITPPDPPPLVFPEPDAGMGKACCDCRFSDIDAVTEEQLDQDLTYCNIYKKLVKLDHSCDGYMDKSNK